MHFSTLVVIDKHEVPTMEAVACDRVEKYLDDLWDWYEVGGRWDKWLRTKGMTDEEEGIGYARIGDVDWEAMGRIGSHMCPYYYISKSGDAFGVEWHDDAEVGAQEFLKFIAEQDEDDFVIVMDFHN